MACIKFHVNGKTYKLTNDSQSEVFNTSDWDIISNLLNNGTIDESYSLWIVEGENEIQLDNVEGFILDVVKVSDELEKSNNVLLDFLSNETISQNEFIDKIVGNAEFSTNNTTSMNHNHLIIPELGRYKWYGFTENRAIKISSSKNNESGDTILLNSYELLKSEYEFVSDIISNLYKDHHDNDETSIYEKLTWLANNDRVRLISELSLPLQQSMFPPKTSKTIIRSAIKTSPDSYIGKLIYYNSEPHLIENINNDNVRILNIITNTRTEIQIKNINNVYNIFSVTNSDGEFILLKGTWYQYLDNQLIEVNAQQSNALFKTHFSISDNSIKVSKGIHLNTIINDIPLGNILKDGSVIYTSDGIYTKKDGKFVSNSDYELSDDSAIFKIISSDINDIKMLKGLINLNPEKKVFSDNQIKVAMYEIFGFEDFDNVWSIYEDNIYPFTVIKSKKDTDKPYIIKMQSKWSRELTPEYMKFMYAAIKYYQYVNDPAHQSEKIIDANIYWPKIVRYLNNIKIKDDETMNWIDQNISDINNVAINSIDLLENMLHEKIDAFKNKIKPEESGKEVDKLFNELISHGIIEWSCTYGMSN